MAASTSAAGTSASANISSADPGPVWSIEIAKTAGKGISPRGLAAGEVAYTVSPAIWSSVLQTNVQLLLTTGGPGGLYYAGGTALLSIMGIDPKKSKKNGVAIRGIGNWLEELFGAAAVRGGEAGTFAVGYWVDVAAILARGDLPVPLRQALEAFPNLLAGDEPISSAKATMMRFVERNFARTVLPPVEDLIVQANSRGSLELMSLRKTHSLEDILVKFAEDDSVSLSGIKFLLIGLEETKYDKCIADVLAEHYGPDTADGRLIDGRRSTCAMDGSPLAEADRHLGKYSFPKSVTPTAARWLFSTFGPSAVYLLETLLGTGSVKFRPYQPLSAADRAPLAAQLAVDLRQLAILTHTPMVSVSNAFGNLKLKEMRLGENFRDFKFLEPTYAVIDGAEDVFQKDSQAIYSTYRLPSPVGHNGRPAQWGHFTAGQHETSMPRLGCHLCGFASKTGLNHLLRHFKDDHKEAGLDKAWHKAAAFGNVVLVNMSSLDFLSLEKRYGGLCTASTAEQERPFAEQGDCIVWFFNSFEWGKWQCLDALYDLLGDTDAPQDIRQTAEALLYLQSLLLHLVESTVISRVVSEGTGKLSTKAVVELFNSYHRSAGMVGQADFLDCVVCVLCLMCGPSAVSIGKKSSIRSTTKEVGTQKWHDLDGQLLGEAVWPLGFRTLRSQYFPYLFETGIAIREDELYEIILIFRRTRNGGWILVGVWIIAFGLWLMSTGITMLNRYLQNSNARRDIISRDLNIPAERLRTSRILLNGLPADASGIPDDVPVIEGWRVGMKTTKAFVDWRPILASTGRSPEGRIYILSASGFDGFLAQPSALLAQLGHWTTGLLVFHVDSRLASGIIKSQSTGTQESVWVEVPKFCQRIRERQSLERIAQLSEQRKYCINAAEEDYVDAQIAAHQDNANTGIQLNDDQRFLYDTILKEMAAEVAMRKYARSGRNTAGSSKFRRKQGQELCEEDQEDIAEDEARYVVPSDEEESEAEESGAEETEEEESQVEENEEKESEEEATSIESENVTVV